MPSSPTAPKSPIVNLPPSIARKDSTRKSCSRPGRSRVKWASLARLNMVSLPGSQVGGADVQSLHAVQQGASGQPQFLRGAGLIALIALQAIEQQVAFDQLQSVAQVHRSEEHTSELQSRPHLVCRLLL